MLNPWDLSGRSVLVTGASSGLGRSISVLVSRLGARVSLVGRDEIRLHETAAQLAGSGHRVERFDLSQVERIPEWLKSVATQVGPIHGLVHSAGMHFTVPLRALQLAKFEELMSTNLTAALYLAKGLRQRGVRAERSSVVFLASVMALVGQPGVSAYAASKGALAAAARCLALELAGENIRVNCLAPGHVRTEMGQRNEASMTPEQVRALEAMHPLGFGEPEDVAHACAFLLADTSRWITGQTLAVDGGYTIH